MKLRNFIKLATPYFPMLFGILGGICVLLGLQSSFTIDRLPYLETVLYVLMILCSLFSLILLRFIVNKTQAYKIIGTKLDREIKYLTKQVNYFRDIADILLESELWAPGLKEYLEKEFAGLNYFDIKEFYKGRNKLALDYMEQNNKFGETESLYLEIKSLLLNDPAQTVVDGFANPPEYDKRILRKWTEHHTGNGIYHYFGFKYVNFKEELDVSRILERHQDIILDYAIQIDSRRYQDMGFSEELLSKLGAQLSEEIIPYLLSATEDSVRKVPTIINTCFILLSTLIIFGIFLPIATLLLGLSTFLGFVSVAAVAGVLTFILFAIYPYVRLEINK